MRHDIPLYQQVYNKILNDINAGLYANGQQLPTEAEAAEQYFVSKITSKKALAMLSEDNVIVRIPGRGSFVKKDFPVTETLSMRESKSPLIALVMGGYSSSFGLDIVNGAVDMAEEMGMHLILKNSGNDQERETSILESLINSGVSGIIVQIAHGELYNEVLVNAVFSKYPIVMIDRTMSGIDAPFVGVDNEKLSRIAVSKLIDYGHSNICLMALEDDHSSSLKERMRGFMEAFADNSLPTKRDLWLTNISDNAKKKGLSSSDPFAHETYVDAIAIHLQQHPEITAIFGTEYSVSKAAWDAARRIGKQVPRDISIASFDVDSAYLGLHLLSHIKQPQKCIGACAVKVMESILAGKVPTNRSFLLEGEWLDGNTIAPPIASSNV